MTTRTTQNVRTPTRRFRRFGLSVGEKCQFVGHNVGFLETPYRGVFELNSSFVREFVISSVLTRAHTRRCLITRAQELKTHFSPAYPPTKCQFPDTWESKSEDRPACKAEEPATLQVLDHACPRCRHIDYEPLGGMRVRCWRCGTVFMRTLKNLLPRRTSPSMHRLYNPEDDDE